VILALGLGSIRVYTEGQVLKQASRLGVMPNEVGDVSAEGLLLLRGAHGRKLAYLGR
jgi:hypothetical protein